jgi:hypothetical protein
MSIRNFLRVSQYTCDYIVVFCCVDSTISTPYPSSLRKKLPTNFGEANNICSNFFRLFVECMYIHCCDALCFQYPQMKPSFHLLLFLRRDWEFQCHLCGITKKYQSWSHSVPFVRTHEQFTTQTCPELVTAYSDCDSFVDKGAWHLCKFLRKYWNHEMLFITNFLVNILNMIITHYRWHADRFTLWGEHLFVQLWTFCTTVLLFIHSIHFGLNWDHIIHDGFPRHSVFGMKKMNNNTNFASDGIINRRT